ncbi:MAG: lipase family protein [Thermoleophilia bacterium]
MAGLRSLSAFYRRQAGRLPWWAAVALGAVAVVLGIAITFKPFSSLGVLVALIAAAFILAGIGELAGARDGAHRWLGALGIVAGIVVAALPGTTIRVVAIVVGVALVLGGLIAIWSAFRGGLPGDERVIAGVGGLARMVFGVLALTWPDVTLKVVGLLVGPAIIIYGAGRIASGLRDRGRPADPAGNADEHRWPSWLRITGVAVTLLVALGLMGVSNAVRDSSPSPDAFYEAPDDVPSQPGQLLRTEDFTRAVPAGAHGWRILYTTTRGDGSPALASAIVVVADDAPAGPRPALAWAHGTTGFAEKCAPSLLANPFAAGVMPALDQVLERGWVLVATDYVGLGTEGPHPYLIGDPEGRSVLDAVRAARQMDQVDVGDQTVVWGHSQGGGAALWTGIIAPRYAPDVPLAGVAALAPATRLPQIFDAVKDSPVGRIMGSYVVSAYAGTYDDVSFDDYIRPAARVSARETADRCLSGPEALVSVGTALGGESWFSQSPSDGPLGRRLQENVPNAPIQAPLLVAQGLADNLVLPAEQRAWVTGRCAAGQSLLYRTYGGFDHVGVVADPSSALPSDLLRWTEDRLAGLPQSTGCRTVVTAAP